MYWGLNRTLCNVFEEMRACDKTKNYAPLLGLIEEAQCYVNRMEASLADQHELKSLHEKLIKSRRELEKLEDKISTLKEE